MLIQCTFTIRIDQKLWCFPFSLSNARFDIRQQQKQQTYAPISWNGAQFYEAGTFHSYLIYSHFLKYLQRILVLVHSLPFFSPYSKWTGGLFNGMRSVFLLFSFIYIVQNVIVKWHRNKVFRMNLSGAKYKLIKNGPILPWRLVWLCAIRTFAVSLGTQHALTLLNALQSKAY